MLMNADGHRQYTGYAKRFARAVAGKAREALQYVSNNPVTSAGIAAGSYMKDVLSGVLASHYLSYNPATSTSENVMNHALGKSAEAVSRTSHRVLVSLASVAPLVYGIGKLKEGNMEKLWSV